MRTKNMDTCSARNTKDQTDRSCWRGLAKLVCSQPRAQVRLPSQVNAKAVPVPVFAWVQAKAIVLCSQQPKKQVPPQLLVTETASDALLRELRVRGMESEW